MMLENKLSTFFGYLDPGSSLVEGVLIGVVVAESRPSTAFASIHRGILLVSEGDSRAWNAVSGGFDALGTFRFLFAALEFPLATG